MCNVSQLTGVSMKRLYPHFALVFYSQSSPTSPEPASLPAEDISTNTNGPKQEILLDDDQEDLFPGI